MVTATFTYYVDKRIILNSNQQLHYQPKRLRTKAIREMSYDVTKQTMEAKSIKMFDHCDLEVKVMPPTMRRLDPPNLYPTVKAIIDGMTDAHLWEDDDWKHIRKTSFEYGGKSPDKEFFVFILKIKEVKKKKVD